MPLQNITASRDVLSGVKVNSHERLRNKGLVLKERCNKTSVAQFNMYNYTFCNKLM